VLAPLVTALLLAPTAQARDPGRWLMTGVSSVPISYWQGLSSDGRSGVVFAGVFEGLWRTTAELRQTRGVAGAIPLRVKLAEGYNHIGDIGFDRAEGGRLLLPLECFVPGRGNTCDTGSIGVADPRTLAWRYYVRLRPAEIAKAMWVEPAPNGRLLWTSSGRDLLAYRAADVSPRTAAPGPPIAAVRRLRDAVPPSGVTGAVFWRGRLLLAGQSGPRYQVWAVDLATGRRRLELELRIRGESEGLHAMRMLGGELHWLIAPFDPRGAASFGPASALLHFVQVHGAARLKVGLATSRRGRRLVAAVRVSRGRPVSGARVYFGAASARTDARGRARLSILPRRFARLRARARKGTLHGTSGWVLLPHASGAKALPRGAGGVALRSGGS
jgi:hypothetical protein